MIDNNIILDENKFLGEIEIIYPIRYFKSKYILCYIVLIFLLLIPFLLINEGIKEYTSHSLVILIFTIIYLYNFFLDAGILKPKKILLTADNGVVVCDKNYKIIDSCIYISDKSIDVRKDKSFNLLSPSIGFFTREDNLSLVSKLLKSNSSIKVKSIGLNHLMRLINTILYYGWIVWCIFLFL